MHTLRPSRYFTVSEGLCAVVIINHMQALIPRSNQLMAHVFYTESYYPLISAGMNTNSVIETTNMDESNGTNLKPILPIIFFFYKLMKIGLVIVPSPDCWLERLLGTTIKLGRKVLMTMCCEHKGTNNWQH
jgi:hypothetical protein